MGCCAQNLRHLVLGSFFVFMILLQTAIQINLSYDDQSQDSSNSQIEYSSVKSRLRKRFISEDNSIENKLLTATLLRPIMTSTPFPTLTTERQQKFALSPQDKITSPSKSSSTATKTKNFPHVSDWSDVPKHLFIDQHYKGNFSLINSELCSRKKNLKLIILVTTALDNFKHRNNVRLTWGHYGQRNDVQFAFVIGDALLSQSNESVQSSFKREVDLYNDFIIGDFSDTYRSLTLKTLHMLDWVSTYCNNAQYFLKTDDDVFLNVLAILNFIQEIKNEDEQTPKIYGHVFSGHYPKRNESHKHHLKYDIYPHNLTYPDFTSGPAYLMSVGIVRPLFYEALKLPLIPLEDVLVSGFAATNLNIPRVNVPGFINEIKNPVDLSSCELLNCLAGMTDGSSIQMNYVWYNFIMGKTICIWKQGGNNNLLSDR